MPAVPALRQEPGLASAWLPLASSSRATTPRQPACSDQGLTRHHRHGDDGAARRLGRACRTTTRDARRSAGHIGSTGSQVVLLRADVRRVPDARADAQAGLTCFFVPRRCPTASATRTDPAPEGQARQPVERLGRDRVHGAEAYRRRGGTRRRDDHRDGRPHAARRVSRRAGIIDSAPLQAAAPRAHRPAFGSALARAAADDGRCSPIS